MRTYLTPSRTPVLLYAMGIAVAAACVLTTSAARTAYAQAPEKLNPIIRYGEAEGLRLERLDGRSILTLVGPPDGLRSQGAEVALHMQLRTIPYMYFEDILDRDQDEVRIEHDHYTDDPGIDLMISIDVSDLLDIIGEINPHRLDQSDYYHLYRVRALAKDKSLIDTVCYKMPHECDDADDLAFRLRSEFYFGFDGLKEKLASLYKGEPFAFRDLEDLEKGAVILILLDRTSVCGPGDHRTVFAQASTAVLERLLMTPNQFGEHASRVNDHAQTIHEFVDCGSAKVTWDELRDAGFLGVRRFVRDQFE